MSYKCHSGKKKSVTFPLEDECKCFTLLTDCCPKDYAVEATTFLSAEMLGRILIFRTDDLARKTRNQRMPLGSDISKALWRHSIHN